MHQTLLGLRKFTSETRLLPRDLPDPYTPTFLVGSGRFQTRDFWGSPLDLYSPNGSKDGGHEKAPSTTITRLFGTWSLSFWAQGIYTLGPFKSWTRPE